MGISLQILRNILSNWGAFGIGAVIQFMMMPFLVHRLGDMQYGIWILIMSFTGYLGLFDFGVSGSVVKYVAEFRAKNDNAGLQPGCAVLLSICTCCGGRTLAYPGLHFCWAFSGLSRTSRSRPRDLPGYAG